MSENPFGDNDYTNPFGDGTTNPYKASSSTPTAVTVNAGSRLLPPAIILIVLSVMTIFATLLQIPRIMADAGEHGGVSYVVGSFLPAILNLIVICGAIQMARLKSYSSAMTQPYFL